MIFKMSARCVSLMVALLALMLGLCMSATAQTGPYTYGGSTSNLAVTCNNFSVQVDNAQDTWDHFFATWTYANGWAYQQDGINNKNIPGPPQSSADHTCNPDGLGTITYSYGMVVDRLTDNNGHDVSNYATGHNSSDFGSPNFFDLAKMTKNDDTLTVNHVWVKNNPCQWIRDYVNPQLSVGVHVATILYHYYMTAHYEQPSLGGSAYYVFRIDSGGYTWRDVYWYGNGYGAATTTQSSGQYTRHF